METRMKWELPLLKNRSFPLGYRNVRDPIGTTDVLLIVPQKVRFFVMQSNTNCISTGININNVVASTKFLNWSDWSCCWDSDWLAASPMQYLRWSYWSCCWDSDWLAASAVQYLSWSDWSYYWDSDWLTASAVQYLSWSDWSCCWDSDWLAAPALPLMYCGLISGRLVVSFSDTLEQLNSMLQKVN
jgi:hypothetical protein